MATPSTDTILARWLDGIATGRPVYIDGRRLSANGRLVSGPWSAHDRPNGANDLAEYLPAGRRRSRPVLLITGDVWTPPPFHSSIQWVVRWALQQRAPALGADTLIIPFSALESARVDRSTIRPLEIRPDRETVDLEPLDLDLDDLDSAPVRLPIDGYTYTGTLYRWRLPDGRYICRPVYTGKHRREYVDDRLTVSVEPLAPAEIRAPTAYRTANASWGDDCRLEPDGRWVIVHRRHWLGDSVFTAEVETDRRRRREWTVADVISAARDVIAGEGSDRYRALNTWSSRESYSTGRTRALERRLMADTVAPASRRLAEIDLTAPIETVETVRRRRRFVSSFDNLEPRPLYYLATLPAGSRARTVADAELDLAPPAVHAAIARGRDVRRQGDIFLIETDLDTTAVYATCDRRARLTQLTRGATARAGEVGAYRPLSARALARIRRRRITEWRRLTSEYLAESPGPVSPAGIRRDSRDRTADLIARLAEYRAKARSAVLTAGGRDLRRRIGLDRYYSGYGADASRYRNYAISTALELAKPAKRLAGRDSYRGDGRRALDLWLTVGSLAFRDEERKRPDRSAILTDTLSVYGTAHSATEVAIIAGRPYVRGIVRHVPSLAGDRWRRPEHAPVKLPDGRWYLAVRNTVPRAPTLDGRR